MHVARLIIYVADKEKVPGRLMEIPWDKTPTRLNVKWRVRMREVPIDKIARGMMRL